VANSKKTKHAADGFKVGAITSFKESAVTSWRMMGCNDLEDKNVDWPQSSFH